jgi:hypothetical protein
MSLADVLQLKGHSFITPDQKFSFYHPYELGNFLVQCWGKENLVGQFVVGCSIYENGRVIKPAEDPRFRKFSWSTKCREGTLRAPDIENLLRDIQQEDTGEARSE